jgi:penicillin-binding protein 1C
MQYARLRWKLNTRTVRGKLAQIFRAVQIERHYGKREIAGAYFTFAPYGGNVEGAAAASLLWCGKPARELTLREAVGLSVIPQSPAARSPRARDRRPSHTVAQARLMAMMRAARGEPPDTLDGEFVLRPVAVPREAPHLARRLAGGGCADTTIHQSQQRIVELSIADFLARWRAQGLRNAAAILIHAPTREVRAYVGSAGFLDERIAGQVDGVTARRSPGSALKPFIYAIALDAGLIHPRTLLDDAPRRFAGYNPENSDRGFLGPISAAEALRRSRNVPAVDLLARLPGGGLDTMLRESGVRLDRTQGGYGLSLALGGAEVSLEELAMLYAMLASDGIPRQLVTGAGAAAASPAAQAPKFSAAARWLTLDALRAGSPVPGLAWKTGTSHGFRDNWACGVAGQWMLCVWVGNFDGSPMPGMFARDTAAPLLFQTATRLGLRGDASRRPAEITDVKVCAITGELSGPHCPHHATAQFIAGVSPITHCTVHREIFVDSASGLRVARDDGRTGLRREVREFWPAHRLEQFRRAGLARLEPPRLEAASAFAGPPPRIVSPQAALTYVLRPDGKRQNGIPLEAEAGADVHELHWFAGNRYLGVSKPSEPLLWTPSPGRWQIEALDDSGRVARVAVTVALHR